MKKTRFLLILALCNIGSLSAQNSDSTFYYDENGQEVWWYFQKDVFAFRMQNGLAYQNQQTNMSVVDRYYHQNQTPRKLNVMEFKPTSLDTDREIERGKPRNQPHFECEFPVISKEKNAPKDAKKWNVTNDIVMVVFKNPLITNNEVAQFANRNKLILVHRPYNNLPTASWMYGFQKRTDYCQDKTTIDIARELYVNESALVKIAEPDMSLYENHSCASAPSEMSSFPSNNRLWFFDNNGGQVYNATDIGLNDADADICECWNAGYMGLGTKVAVIGFGSGFDFDHYELDGVYLPGWNFITNTPLQNTYIVDNQNSHYTSLVGLIAGNINDGGTIGVAPDCQIIPYQTSSNQFTVIQAIQKAVSDGADIVHMSFGAVGASSLAHNDILNGVSFGRPDPWDPSTFLGTIFVSSVGNENQNTDPVYPAAHPEVIGVGASNLHDFRCHKDDGVSKWDVPWLLGSNYGPFDYEVVAPGCFMEVITYNNANYNDKGGTSYSAAIVSGIVAMLLQKNPQLYWYEIHNAINYGAESVHNGSSYNYNENVDKNNEVFHGRASCIGSLNYIPMGVGKLTKSREQFALSSKANGNFVLHKLHDGNEDKQVLKVLNSLGQELAQLPLNEKETNLDLSGYSKGIYFLGISDKKHNFIQNFKVIVE